MGKIYPQTINGKYYKVKNYVSIVLLIVYFGGSWIRWDRGLNIPGQAVILDLPGRRGYFFAIEIWPEEVLYITGILTLAALGLFLFTTLFGRLWCGYACPHTVFTDLFIRIERFFQGDRNARVMLDSRSWDMDKLLRKLATNISWLALSFMFAFGWVCYFYDAPSLLYDILHFNVSASSALWLFCLMFVTYFLAGFMREKVCIYCCPYGRFQSAMLDTDTLLVTYNNRRGEPRGYSVENNSYGDCIDCGKCVVVCPMGIDIRDGLQMSCIGCGLCIDACDSVMSKLKRPLGLISYDNARNIEMKVHKKYGYWPLLRPKAIFYASMFIIVIVIMFYALLYRQSYMVSIERGRGPLFTIAPNGYIRNTYFLKVYNKASYAREFCISAEGIKGVTIRAQGYVKDYVEQFCFRSEGRRENEMHLFVLYKDKDRFSEGALLFRVMDSKSRSSIVVKSSFIFNSTKNPG